MFSVCYLLLFEKVRKSDDKWNYGGQVKLKCYIPIEKKSGWISFDKFQLSQQLINLRVS